MTDPTADDTAAAARGRRGRCRRHRNWCRPSRSTAALEAAAEFKDKLLRTLAEMENLRKRTEREVADARVYGVAGFARDVLAVADNMHRALGTIEAELREHADAKMKALIEGVELTERELMKVLEKYGVTKFSPAGEKFDPNVHQAMYEVREFRAAGGPRGAGHPGRLHARRPRAAPGLGCGRQGGAEIAAILRQRQSAARRRREVDFSADRSRRARRGSG